MILTNSALILPQCRESHRLKTGIYIILPAEINQQMIATPLNGEHVAVNSLMLMDRDSVMQAFNELIAVDIQLISEMALCSHRKVSRLTGSDMCRKRYGSSKS